MSTSINTNRPNATPRHPRPSAAQRRAQVRRRNRRVRMGVFCGLVGTIATMSITHSSTVRYLEEQIAVLSAEASSYHAEASYLSEENTYLLSKLDDVEQRLKVFVDTNEVLYDPVTIYKIPLDAALQEYTYNLCVDYSIPEHYELVLAMMWQESNFNPDVISSTKDYGLMQININNHAWLSDELGITDFLDPEQNIHAGVYIIAKLIHEYDDVHKALMAYNMGERGAAKFWDNGICSSNYSRSIVGKRDNISLGEYEAN